MRCCGSIARARLRGEALGRDQGGGRRRGRARNRRARAAQLRSHLRHAIEGAWASARGCTARRWARAWSWRPIFRSASGCSNAPPPIGSTGCSARAGLPVAGPALGTGRYLDLMAIDKKAEAGRIRFILLDRLARPASSTACRRRPAGDAKRLFHKVAPVPHRGALTRCGNRLSRRGSQVYSQAPPEKCTVSPEPRPARANRGAP